VIAGGLSAGVVCNNPPTAVDGWSELMPVQHVLFDADGVLQDLPGGWCAAMEPYLGERSQEFLDETWSDELPMLAGRGDYLPVLAATLERYGVRTPVTEVYDAVWKNIVLIEESLDLVRTLRRNGYGVHLGTNQEVYRGTHMRTELGYDELFDVSCYSYDLGVAKPDPAFFTRAADRIGADPTTILFIDDTARNITGARTAGLKAEQWTFPQGHPTLHKTLATHGVTATLPAD
jgi:putative hydrolase of the HAD superfamily